MPSAVSPKGQTWPRRDVPMTIAHPCPGCLRVTTRPGRCVACGGGTTTQRGYGADWRRRRAQQLLRHPACQWRRSADADRCGRPATDVDHVVPKVHGGSDEPGNLQSLCTAHHRRKTATQDGRWATHVDRREDARPLLRRSHARMRPLLPAARNGRYEVGTVRLDGRHLPARPRLAVDLDEDDPSVRRPARLAG